MKSLFACILLVLVGCTSPLSLGQSYSPATPTPPSGFGYARSAQDTGYPTIYVVNAIPDYQSYPVTVFILRPEPNDCYQQQSNNPRGGWTIMQKSEHIGAQPGEYVPATSGCSLDSVELFFAADPQFGPSQCWLDIPLGSAPYFPSGGIGADTDCWYQNDSDGSISVFYEFVPNAHSWDPR